MSTNPSIPVPTRSRSISSSLRRLVVAPAVAAAAALSSTSPYVNAGVPLTFASNAEDFIQQEMIGYGSSASVYRATHIPTGRTVSIKIIELESYLRNQIEQLRRETQVMLLCRHPNLLPVHTSFVHSSKLAIVTPYLAGGSVLDIMRSGHPRGIEEASIATILKQVLLGLAYLHRNGHIHRDVKAGNFLVDSDGTVMLADFGVTASLELSDRHQTSRRTFVGTPCWMAPEVMEQARYDSKADVWSTGITALEMANGEAPLAKFPPIKVLMLTISGPTPSLQRDVTDHKYSRTFSEFIDFCLRRDPSVRPTVEQLLAHSFMGRAKKKQWLVQNLLCGLSPLPERVKARLNCMRRSTAAQHQHYQLNSVAHKNTKSSVLDESSLIDAWDFEPSEAITAKVEVPGSSSAITEKNQDINNDLLDKLNTIKISPQKDKVEINSTLKNDNTVPSGIMKGHALHEILDPCNNAVTCFMPSGDVLNPSIISQENRIDEISKQILPISTINLASFAVAEDSTPTGSVPIKKGRFSVEEPKAKDNNILVNKNNIINTISQEDTVGQTLYKESIPCVEISSKINSKIVCVKESIGNTTSLADRITLTAPQDQARRGRFEMVKPNESFSNCNTKDVLPIFSVENKEKNHDEESYKSNSVLNAVSNLIQVNEANLEEKIDNLGVFSSQIVEEHKFTSSEATADNSSTIEGNRIASSEFSSNYLCTGDNESDMKQHGPDYSSILGNDSSQQLSASWGQSMCQQPTTIELQERIEALHLELRARVPNVEALAITVQQCGEQQETMSRQLALVLAECAALRKTVEELRAGKQHE